MSVRSGTQLLVAHLAVSHLCSLDTLCTHTHGLSTRRAWCCSKCEHLHHTWTRGVSTAEKSLSERNVCVPLITQTPDGTTCHKVTPRDVQYSFGARTCVHVDFDNITMKKDLNAATLRFKLFFSGRTQGPSPTRFSSNISNHQMSVCFFSTVAKATVKNYEVDQTTDNEFSPFADDENLVTWPVNTHDEESPPASPEEPTYIWAANATVAAIAIATAQSIFVL